MVLVQRGQRSRNLTCVLVDRCTAGPLASAPAVGRSLCCSRSQLSTCGGAGSVSMNSGANTCNVTSRRSLAGYSPRHGPSRARSAAPRLELGSTRDNRSTNTKLLTNFRIPQSPQQFCWTRVSHDRCRRPRGSLRSRTPALDAMPRVFKPHEPTRTRSASAAPQSRSSEWTASTRRRGCKVFSLA